MAPNASMMLFDGAVDNGANNRHQQHNQQQQQQNVEQSSPDQPRKQFLRRSPPASFGFFSDCVAQTNPIELCNAQLDSLGHQCPAPLNQVELQFTLLESSPSTSSNFSMLPSSNECHQPCSFATTTTKCPFASSDIPIQIQMPNGQTAMLHLSGTNPSATFCARQSNDCGHGKWQIHVGRQATNVLALWLDGVGSLHFWVLPEIEEEEEGKKDEAAAEMNNNVEKEQQEDKENNNNSTDWRRMGKQVCGGRLLLRERQFLRMPTAAFCRKQQQEEEMKKINKRTTHC